MDIHWNNLSSIGSTDYQCGYCGKVVASDKGYFANTLLEGHKARIYICPHCARPSFFYGGVQSPQVAPGNEVQHLPDQIQALYREARNCVAATAYTASVLACRKLLMNIAVEQGADEGLRFIEYVDYLADNGFVPPNGRGWVDHIRKKGNEATHEINLMTADDAAELIAFAEMLLKFIFEFPAKVPGNGGQNA